MMRQTVRQAMWATLQDISLESDATIGVKAECECEEGFGISLDNHQTKTTAEGFADAVVYLELCDGKPILRIWADINSEEPTHVIDLSGAHINRRLTTFKGNLYFMDEQGVKNHICDFEETGETAAAMEKKVLDQLWDSRLDAASCTPHFEYKIVC